MTTHRDIEEELLVLACQAGDRASFARLAERWQPRLLAIARGACPSEQHALDVVQSSWLAIARGLSRLASPTAFGAWAARIVRNQAASQARRHATRQRLDPSLPHPVSDPSPPRDPAIERALGALSQEHRVVIDLYYGADLGIRELAQLLELPQGTGKSRLHHARRKLRHILEDTHD